MKSKRILFTYALPYPHIGGLSTHMQLMGKGLKNLGYEVDFISYSSFPRIIQLILLTGPMYVFDKLYQGFGSLIYFHYMSKLLFNLLFFYKFIIKKYDLVNAHHIFSIPSQKLLKLFKIPVILTVHTYFTYEMISMGIILDNSSFSQKMSIKYEKKAYESVSHMITVDRRLKEYLVDMGVDNNKIDVMFNPVDTERFIPRDNKNRYKHMFGLPENKKILLCPRRLEKKNGVIYPLLAFSELNRKDLTLVYAGDGQEKEKIKSLIERNGLEKEVLLLGSVNHEKMNFLYNAADIVLIPSIHSEGMEEASSISALEAMASGVPVIASDIGGLSDIIKDKFNGMLIPDGDVKLLTETILKLLNNSKLYDNISKNSVQCANNKFSYISRTNYLLKMEWNN